MGCVLLFWPRGAVRPALNSALGPLLRGIAGTGTESKRAQGTVASRVSSLDPSSFALQPHQPHLLSPCPAAQKVGEGRANGEPAPSQTWLSASLGLRPASGVCGAARVEQGAAGTLGCPSAFGVAQRTASSRDQHAAWTPPVRFSQAWEPARLSCERQWLRLAWVRLLSVGNPEAGWCRKEGRRARVSVAQSVSAFGC